MLWMPTSRHGVLYVTSGAYSGTSKYRCLANSCMKQDSNPGLQVKGVMADEGMHLWPQVFVHGRPYPEPVFKAVVYS